MNRLQTLSLVLAASLAGVALAKFGNAASLASLQVDKLFAIVAGLALAGFAFYDYSRRHQPLLPKARLLRPALPSGRAPLTPGSGASRGPAAHERTAA